MNLAERFFPELPKGGWLKVTLWTAATTALTCVLSMAGTAIARSGGDLSVLTPADFITAIALALVLAVPIIATVAVKMLQLQLANQKLERFATTDAMTGLLNREAFTRKVETLLDVAMEQQFVAPGCLLAIDVDRFKRVNDTFGHHWGDEALRLIADAVKGQLRDVDIAGRMGGEEFGIFLVDCRPAAAVRIAERIRTAVAAIEFFPEGHLYPLSISVGIGSPQPGQTFLQVYRASDVQLYRAKSNGRNRVELESRAVEVEAPSEPDTTSVSARASG